MKTKLKLNIFLSALTNIFTIFGVVILVFGAYYLGFVGGYKRGGDEALSQIVSSKEVSIGRETNISESESTLAPQPTPAPKTSSPSWSGPDLWEAVNKRRIELGVNPLSTKSELCTIASIRLNQLLALGTLDGHEGFSKMPEERADLVWIFEKYNLTEFLVAGADSPQEAVSLWENTLGHSKLLDGGEYVWGCIYAQEGFGVAITAY